MKKLLIVLSSACLFAATFSVAEEKSAPCCDCCSTGVCGCAECTCCDCDTCPACHP